MLRSQNRTAFALQVLHYLDTIEPQDLLSQMLATAFSSALDLLAAARGASVQTVSELREALASEMAGALELGVLQQQTKGGVTIIVKVLELSGSLSCNPGTLPYLRWRSQDVLFAIAQG